MLKLSDSFYSDLRCGAVEFVQKNHYILQSYYDRSAYAVTSYKNCVLFMAKMRYWEKHGYVPLSGNLDTKDVPGSGLPIMERQS